MMVMIGFSRDGGGADIYNPPSRDLTDNYEPAEDTLRGRSGRSYDVDHHKVLILFQPLEVNGSILSFPAIHHIVESRAKERCENALPCKKEAS